MANYADGYLQRGAPVGMQFKTVYLTADNTAITPNDVSLIFIGSDNTTATNRTFTIATSTLVGQQLLLIFNTGSSTTAQLQDTGAMRLVVDWLPIQYDAILIVSDGTNWIEVGRGNTTTGVPTMALASAHIYVGNGSGVATDVEVTGDVTISNAGVTAIASGVIVNADVNASAAIAYSKLNLATSIVNADVAAAAAISFSKLAALTDGNILVGNASNVPVSVAVTGDVVISNAGVTNISSGVIVNADVNASAAIAYSKLALTNSIVMGDFTAAVKKEATGTLSQANILGMNATPVELIAAPAAGLLHIIDEVELFHDYSTTAYANGGDVTFEYGGGQDIQLIDVAFVTNTTDSTVVMKPTVPYTATGGDAGVDLVSSVATNIRVTNATAAFINGNAANIIKWRIRYHTVTVLA